MKLLATFGLGVLLCVLAVQTTTLSQEITPDQPAAVPAAPHSEAAPGHVQADPHAAPPSDYWSMIFVFVLATFIGMGVIAKVSRLLHTPLMSLTNAISAIAVVGSIIVTGSDYPVEYRILGAIALFASMTNIVSGFLITDRMLKMFKQTRQEDRP